MPREGAYLLWAVILRRWGLPFTIGYTSLLAPPLRIAGAPRFLRFSRPTHISRCLVVTPVVVGVVRLTQTSSPIIIMKESHHITKLFHAPSIIIHINLQKEMNKQCKIRTSVYYASSRHHFISIRALLCYAFPVAERKSLPRRIHVGHGVRCRLANSHILRKEAPHCHFTIISPCAKISLSSLRRVISRIVIITVTSILNIICRDHYVILPWSHSSCYHYYAIRGQRY